MSIEALAMPCYLVEWYRPQLTARLLEDMAIRLDQGVAAMCGAGSTVRLLMTLAVPTDEVIFGIFAAPSAEIICEACRRAGFPAERLTNAVNTRIAG